MRHLLALALAAVLAAPAARALDVKSPGPDWTEANRTDDLVIFTKDVEKGRKLVAVSEIDAAPEVIFKVVGDFDNYADFMPYVKESRVLSRKGDRELTAYTLLELPLVSERDYALLVSFTKGTPENGGVFKTEWTAKPQAQPEREGVVRVVLNDGSWTLEPLDGGKRTRVTYTLLTHPGGSIPNWIANKSNTTAIPDLFAAIRKRSTSKK